MECHDTSQNTNNSQLVDSDSSKKLKQREWRKANKLRNLEIARGRWAEKVEKFIESKNIIKAYRDNEPRRLECIADELWKLKNVEECQDTKPEGKVKKYKDENIGAFLRTQIAEKEMLRQQMRAAKLEERCLASLNLKSGSVEEEAVEKYKKKYDLRKELLAQIKNNCLRNKCANEESLREGMCLIERDLEQLRERQMKQQEIQKKTQEEAKASWQLQRQWKTEALKENVRSHQEFEEKLKRELESIRSSKRCKKPKDDVSDRLRKILECDSNEKERDERMRIELSWLEKDMEAGAEERRRADAIEAKKKHWKEILQQFIRDHTKAKECSFREAGDKAAGCSNSDPCCP